MNNLEWGEIPQGLHSCTYLKDGVSVLITSISLGDGSSDSSNGNVHDSATLQHSLSSTSIGAE